MGGTLSLTLASKLSSASKAAGRSTLKLDTDPARLRPTACASLRANHVPTAQRAHQTTTGREAAQAPLTAASTAPDTTCAQSGRQQSAWTIHGGSRVAYRLDRRQDLRGLSNARR